MRNFRSSKISQVVVKRALLQYFNGIFGLNRIKFGPNYRKINIQIFRLWSF